MRHLTISEFGSSLGVSGNRLVVRHEGEIWETPLSRLRSIRVEKKGVSISSNLIYECSMRGIRLYFVDWRNIAVATVSGENQHAVVAIRQAQLDCVRSEAALPIAAEMIISKIRNQRAVLLYFGKYLSKKVPETIKILDETTARMSNIVLDIKTRFVKKYTADWRQELLGYEGICARLYWNALIDSGLLPSTFVQREGRGSLEVTNAALNYGYTILQSYAWSALDNAGFELYAGLLHANRPGKPSLVLDFMEEYRAWVVDRNIIRLRHRMKSPEDEMRMLDKSLKESIVNSVDDSMSGLFLYNKKKLKLENIMQRQAYRLAGAIYGDRHYRGFRFKW